MRTFRGIPECNLPLGRRFTTIITHTCDDEDDPYVETTFVDVAPGRIDVLLRPHTDFTTVFPIQVISEHRPVFAMIRSWFSMVPGRPFSVPSADVMSRDNCINIRIRGYFDTRFEIRFHESDFADAVDRFGSLTQMPTATKDYPRSIDATKSGKNAR